MNPKKRTITILAALLPIIAAMLFTGCGTPGSGPGSGIVIDQVATDIALQLMASEYRRKHPETASEVLVILRAIQTGKAPEAWPDNLEAEALALALERTLVARLEDSQKQAAIAAVIRGLEGGK